MSKDGRTAEADGLSQAEPEVSALRASIPCAGQYAIFDWGKGRDSQYEVRRIEKVTAKLVKMEGGRWPRQVERERVIFSVDDPDKAAFLKQSLDGIHGEYRRREFAANKDYRARLNAALAAKLKQVAALASATEARRAETAKTDSVHEGAVPQGDAQPPTGQPS